MHRLGPIWLLVLGALLILGVSLDRGAEFRGRRPPPLPPGAIALGPSSPADPTVNVEDPHGQVDSMGTAFPLGAAGVWVTARHVVEGCDRLELQLTVPEPIVLAAVRIHPEADVAVIDGGPPRSPLPFPETALYLDEPAFHYGFPSGWPGAATSLLLGRTWVRTPGVRGYVAPAIVWAETSRVPFTLTRLAGMSGGPILDEHGDVVGVTVAESVRRGRIVGATPASLRELLAEGDDAGEPDAGDDNLSDATFLDVGDDLLHREQLARLRCYVD
jgi:serine protease Do